MGYALVYGFCCICNQSMTFNPVHVPSVRIEDKREPVCKSCIEKANVVRKEKSLEPISLLPDAYDACDEAELFYDN
jgi:hypothetical protein